MSVFDIGRIRNIALLGHNGAGKTSLGEALLHLSGTTTRLGSVDQGTSVLDYDEESRERKHSTQSSVFYIDHNDHRLNVIDTPGMPDYAGQALASLAAVETAVIVVCATTGITVNARRMFKAASDFGLARMVVISRINADAVDLEQVYRNVKETFGEFCHPINLPADGGKRTIDVLSAEEGDSDIMSVSECHTELLDSIVETDDKLMERYMGGEKIDPAELRAATARAVASGHVIPVFFADSHSEVGIPVLLNELCVFAPSPLVGKQRNLVEGAGDDAKTTPIEPSADGPFIAQCFKIASDPKSHIKHLVCRVLSGKINKDSQILVGEERKAHRPGHILKLQHEGHIEIDEAGAGDLIAFAKLEMQIGDIVHDKPLEGRVPLPKFPTPMYSLAAEPKNRGDADKIGAALGRFAEEDPCFEYHRDEETHELLLSGLGDLHLNMIQAKMKRDHKLEVETHLPKIPYRETIAGSAKDVDYTHKKQSGGAGQFAKVVINLEPTQRGDGYEFVDKIFGGAIDQAFRPSVDKGIRAQMVKGVIAGCPVVDVKVELIDGKTHPVDSKDVAFQVAGRNAFKKAFAAAKPILLEPIVHIDVTAPADYVGDVTRDIAGKRGQIEGQDQLPGNIVTVRGTLPLSEVAVYASQLKSMTAGQGSYVMEFSHYDVVPPNVQQQIVAKFQPKEEED